MSQDAFTDYTDTDGQWNTVDSDGDLIDKTVWTRYIHITDEPGLSKIPTQVIILTILYGKMIYLDNIVDRGLLLCVLNSCPVRHLCVVV